MSTYTKCYIIIDYKYPILEEVNNYTYFYDYLNFSEILFLEYFHLQESNLNFL